MAVSNLSKWLSSVEDTAVASLAEAKESAISEFEDGTYVALVTQHEFKTSSNDNPGIATKFMIVESNEPAYVGETKFDWQGLERDDAFKYFGWRLASMGIALGDPKDIIAELRRNPSDVFDIAANQTVVRIKLTTNKSQKDGREFQNLSILKVIPDYDLTGFAQEAAIARKETSDNSSTEAEEDADDGSAKVGMKVSFKTVVGKGKAKKEIEGTAVITAINEDDETIDVRDDEGNEYTLDCSEEAEDTVELIPEKAV